MGDWLYPAYREIGAALYRGYPLNTFMCQLFGNADDPVKGRQMPVHHSVRRLNFVSVSSPVGSQIPHAVGTAWAAKLQKTDDVALAFFGDGATSTPTFHVSATFAALYKVPAILFCRNNGWAISVPSSMQSATPSFAQKAIAYGMQGVLVDGNDLLAVIHVVAEAAARARRGEGPTLIEARTYRRGAHSTSDDPSVYRDPAEPKAWERRDPARPRAPVRRGARRRWTRRSWRRRARRSAPRSAPRSPTPRGARRSRRWPAWSRMSTPSRRRACARRSPRSRRRLPGTAPSARRTADRATEHTATARTKLTKCAGAGNRAVRPGGTRLKKGISLWTKKIAQRPDGRDAAPISDRCRWR